MSHGIQSILGVGLWRVTWIYAQVCLSDEHRRACAYVCMSYIGVCMPIHARLTYRCLYPRMYWAGEEGEASMTITGKKESLTCKFGIFNLQGKMSLYRFFLMFSGCSDAAVGYILSDLYFVDCLFSFCGETMERIKANDVQAAQC